jgi:hypothetical protein
MAYDSESSDAMFSQLFLMQQQVEDLRMEISANFIESCRHLRQVNTNLRQIPLVPAACHRLLGDAEDQQHHKIGDVKPVLGLGLSKRPRDLYVLWREFEVGLDGGKPVRDYTPSERGANRYTFSQHKNYWDAVGSLLIKGYSVDLAIDMVYEAYGKNYSVTAILDAIIVDKHMNISRF